MAITLVPVDRNEIKKNYKPTKNYELLNRFREMDAEAVVLDGAEYSSPSCGAHTLNHSIKRYKMHGIVAISRKGKIYLLKVGDSE